MKAQLRRAANLALGIYGLHRQRLLPWLLLGLALGLLLAWARPMFAPQIGTALMGLVLIAPVAYLMDRLVLFPRWRVGHFDELVDRLRGATAPPAEGDPAPPPPLARREVLLYATLLEIAFMARRTLIVLGALYLWGRL